MITNPGPDRLDNAQVREIIRRAVEIDDSVRSTVDRDQLRRIAESIGISPHAVDQALSEMREEALTHQRKMSRRRRVGRFLLGAMSLIFAYAAKFVDLLFARDPNTSLLPAVLILLGGLALGLLLYNRRRGDARTFQLDNAAIWTGFTLGWFVLIPDSLSSSLPGVIAWAAFAALGSVLVPRERPKPPSGSADHIRHGWLKAIRRWLSSGAPVERRSIERVVSPEA